MLLTLGLICADQALAKRIYSYVDEDGIRHYTDRKPSTDLPVTERLITAVDNSEMVTLRTDKQEGEHHVLFYNHWHGPISIELKLTEQDNIRVDPPLPGRFLLPDHGEYRIATVRPDDRRQGWQYALRMDTAVPGEPGVDVDRTHGYRVPFRPSKSFYVGQGFGGEATHQDRQSYYAIDISMPEGTPVTAARDGVVMHVEKDFHAGGTRDPELASRANTVRIIHADGSMAIYAHLKLESVLVKPGRTVLAGEVIALSGNTGYSTGPHLHFAVQINRDMTLESIPFEFEFDDGTQARPRPGHWLNGTGQTRARR